MAISIKTPEDIEKMRVAGRLAAEVLEMIEPYVKPGVSTGELDRICNDYIVNEQHAVSACLGYHGYPKSVCISINEVVCHGIPDDAKLLKDGDIVNIDVTVIKDGFHGDTSKMFIVGKPTIMGERLCRITQESLYLALRMVKPGINLREIGAAIQKFVEAEGFSADKMDEFDAVAFGCPSMGCEELEDTIFEPMFASCESKLQGKKIALFGSYGWGDGEWMQNWEETCKNDGASLACDSVICNETPDDEAEANCVNLGKTLA